MGAGNGNWKGGKGTEIGTETGKETEKEKRRNGEWRKGKTGGRGKKERKSRRTRPECARVRGRTQLSSHFRLYLWFVCNLDI